MEPDFREKHFWPKIRQYVIKLGLLKLHLPCWKNCHPFIVNFKIFFMHNFNVHHGYWSFSPRKTELVPGHPLHGNVIPICSTGIIMYCKSLKILKFIFTEENPWKPKRILYTHKMKIEFLISRKDILQNFISLLIILIGSIYLTDHPLVSLVYIQLITANITPWKPWKKHKSRVKTLKRAKRRCRKNIWQTPF